MDCLSSPLSFSILIYDFSSSFFFSSCQRCIHFACVTSSVSLRAVNLSLNYHSRDKLRGPPLSSGSWLVLITLSLPYHTLWSLALSESYCLRQEVRGRRGMPPLQPSLHPTVNPYSFSACLYHPSNPFSCLHRPAPPPFSDPLNRPLQYRFIRSIKVKVVILSDLLIRLLYWAGQGAKAESIPVALWGLDTVSYIPAAHCKDQALSAFLVKGALL